MPIVRDHYHTFKTLLRRRFGLTPSDIGIDSPDDYYSLAGNDTPQCILEWLKDKYDLVPTRETNDLP